MTDQGYLFTKPEKKSVHQRCCYWLATQRGKCWQWECKHPPEKGSEDPGWVFCGRPDRAMSPRGSRENKHGATPTTETLTHACRVQLLASSLPSSTLPTLHIPNPQHMDKQVRPCPLLRFALAAIHSVWNILLQVFLRQALLPSPFHRWGNRCTERLNTFHMNSRQSPGLQSGYAVPASVSKHDSVSNLSLYWHSNWFTPEPMACLSQPHKDLGP